jgi:hypothetical protein
VQYARSTFRADAKARNNNRKRVIIAKPTTVMMERAKFPHVHVQDIPLRSS